MSSTAPTGQAHGRSEGLGDASDQARAQYDSGFAQPSQSSASGYPVDDNANFRGFSSPAGAHEAQTSVTAGGVMSMTSMAGALPNVRSAHPVAAPQGFQRPPPAMSNMPQSPPQQSMPSFAGQVPPGMPGPALAHQQYVQSYPTSQQQFLPYMAHPAAHPQGGHSVGFAGQPFSSVPYYGGQQQQPPAGYMYYPPGYGQMNPAQQFQGALQTGGGVVGGGMSIPPSMAGPGVYSPQTTGAGGSVRRPSATGNQASGSPSKGAIPSAPRGPPRKPKQSGHALWVGNLPPGAQVQELKDHFARDATRDIESVFLISKSNCAFVNYRTEEACAAAMTRFHDSRFKGVRLVCRYRSSGGGSAGGTPTGPSTASPPPQQSQTAVEAISQNREVSSRAEESMRQLDGAAKINDKYFVVKSLTVEDLELSAQNGIWATQAHNEDALNKAFESVENVYLVFSANKSGEYFGYAKMISPINEEWASKLDWKPRTEIIVDDPKLPRSIPTPATETAPRGRIIDDSARGTIFWEVESSSEDEESNSGVDDLKSASPDKEGGTPEEEAGPQTFGRPFKIEWLSTSRLPFYRTRGLRNPWNANRDVKIARDGTELETSVGRRLVQMFHRAAAHAVAPPIISPISPATSTGYTGAGMY